LKRRMAVGSAIAILLVALFAAAALATDAKMYFSSDNKGQNPVTNVKEGDQVFIVVDDPDENIDCDLRDKIWTDVKIFDPKTGAYSVWLSYGPKSAPVLAYKGKDGDTTHDATTPSDYLEETGADTGLFVSNHAFCIGTREDFSQARLNTHVVDATTVPDMFQWGNYEYTAVAISNDGNTNGKSIEDPNLKIGLGDDRIWWDAVHTARLASGATAVPFATAVLPSLATYASTTETQYLLGRFENMDTLIGMYQDQNDEKDVALGLMKITDTEAQIAFDQEIYKDPRGAAMITVTDPDENLDCNKIEYVPVFVLVNPGSWIPIQTHSATNFCTLEHWGGVSNTNSPVAGVLGRTIRWYNIYDSGIGPLNPSTGLGAQPDEQGSYYIQYPKSGVHTNVNYFDTASDSGVTRVMFYAQETGVNTGVFQWNLNNILTDLGFVSLRVRDVLVAYYLDPNDFDDFKLTTAYIEEHQHSLTSFTDATRNPKRLFWIGRDPVYVQVIDSNANVDPCCPEQVVVHICDPHGEDDSEWLILDETSSNSPVFFTNAGTQLLPVWDALGIGLSESVGGYQLQLDNWKIEAFNEDSIYARYNDVYYELGSTGMTGLGDVSVGTAFPPIINRVRVENDVSFDLMEIADTQVYNGTSTTMYFLDRQGNRVSGYVNSDCVFIEVIDPDQNEDNYRRERVDAYFDGGQNVPFGPQALNVFECTNTTYCYTNGINDLLGDTNIFSDNPSTSLSGYDALYACQTRSTRLYPAQAGWAKVYVLNPRNGHWAATDILETGVGTADFVSVICIDLVSVYSGCVPTLGVLPGDTVLAFYQDPSNYSDSAMISIKVGVGGGGTPPGQGSTTKFTDASGNLVANYMDVDTVYVKVVDPSHAGAASLLDAVKIGTATFDLAPLAGAATDTFITGAITLTELGKGAGDTITATYTDPTDPSDTSSATISVIASELVVEEFIAKPNPFATETVFTYVGSGIATTFTVTVYDLAGHVVWTDEKSNVSEVTWDGKNASGVALANGAYIYVVLATDGTNTFTGKGKVFIDR